MISVIITILKIVFILGFLVFIHEGGHFLVAKLCKVKVNEFAIGFGPILFSKQGKETIYRLRLIPLGGFVSMEGEEERSEESGSFSKASIPKRIAIVAAGGLVNILFALIVYFILLSFTGNNVSNIIDGTIPDTGAEIAGLQSGDEIIKINDKKIHYKSDFDKLLKQCNGEPLRLLIKRNGKEETITIDPMIEKYNYTGIAVQSSADNNTKIAAVYPKSPAEQQGLVIGDIILKINDIDVLNDVTKLLEEINKVDSNFYIKLQESKYVTSDTINKTIKITDSEKEKLKKLSPEEINNRDIDYEDTTKSKTEEFENSQIEKSFFTNSMSFSKKDFEGFEDLENNMKKSSFFTKVAIFLIILMLLGTIFIILNYVLDLKIF